MCFLFWGFFHYVHVIIIFLIWKIQYSSQNHTVREAQIIIISDNGFSYAAPKPKTRCIQILHCSTYGGMYVLPEHRDYLIVMEMPE